jgi:hypothetical protein
LLKVIFYVDLQRNIFKGPWVSLFGLFCWFTRNILDCKSTIYSLDCCW